MQMKLFPPFDHAAPSTKSHMPPLPEICEPLWLSALICEKRSACTAPQMLTTLSFAAMTRGSLV